MSIADIRDNKWELESIRPPIRNPGAIGVIIMMTCFSLFFVAIIIGSVIGSFTETKVMNFDGKAPEASTPKAEAE
jgi:hypothetical protein